jgi:isochorismate pyruvate lyase
VSLAEVRAQIDRIDDRIVALLAERQQLVRQAGTYKAEEAAVRAPDRRASMMQRLRRRSIEEGVSPEVVARVYTAMIDGFIELEMAQHRARDGG